MKNAKQMNVMRPRQGSLVVIVLVSLTLVVILVGVAAKHLLRERRLMGDQQRSMQAEYLASAGVARAAAQLARNSHYRGESWEVDANLLRTRDGGAVEIQVTADDKNLLARRIRAVADFPAKGDNRCRRSFEKTILVQAKEESP